MQIECEEVRRDQGVAVVVTQRAALAGEGVFVERAGLLVITQRMQIESEAFAERLQSAEAREAFTAFFEKRKPDFQR